MGIGLLALPFSIHAAGWVGITTLFISCAFAWFTAFLVCWSIERSGLYKPNYGELLAITFPRSGRSIARLLLVVNLFGMACVLLTVVWAQIEVRTGKR